MKHFDSLDETFDITPVEVEETKPVKKKKEGKPLIISNKEDDKEKLYSDIDKILGSKTSVLFDKGAVTNKNIGDVFPTMAAFQRRDPSKTRDHFVNQAKAKRPVITAASNLFRGIFRDPNEEE